MLSAKLINKAENAVSAALVGIRQFQISLTLFIRQNQTKPKPQKDQVMKIAIALTYWTVIYANGTRRYFKTEESARAEAVIYGIGLIAPLYR